MSEKLIEHDADVWRILSTGVTRDDRKTFCHLASTTRAVMQSNGERPVQICDWVDLRDPITAYYEDKAGNGHGQPPPIPRF